MSQYASQSGEVPNVLKQFLVEMNINIAAAEATELEHNKTFDELSDTRIEEIAASNQQHKDKRLKKQDELAQARRNLEVLRAEASETAAAAPPPPHTSGEVEQLRAEVAKLRMEKEDSKSWGCQQKSTDCERSSKKFNRREIV